MKGVNETLKETLTSHGISPEMKCAIDNLKETLKSHEISPEIRCAIDTLKETHSMDSTILGNPLDFDLSNLNYSML